MVRAFASSSVSNGPQKVLDETASGRNHDLGERSQICDCRSEGWEGMRIGLTIDAPSTVVADAQQAEELGFDFLACGEHLFFHGPVSNSFAVLAAAAPPGAGLLWPNPASRRRHD